MRRRPQPNPRRGLLRAAAAILILTILLLAVILVVSSLTAPPAKAPVVPPTPGPTSTPATRGTPGPAATPTHTKGLSLAPSGRRGWSTLLSETGTDVFARAVSQASRPRSGDAPSPDGHSIAYFIQTGDAYARNLLFVARAGSTGTRVVGFGDPLVRPVWSPDGRYLVYVRVAPTGTFPGAAWSLILLDVRSGGSTVLVRQNAMNLTPLGWSHARLLYLVANTTDTSLYAVERGRVSFVSLLMPQPVITAELSPNGLFVALGAPTNCAYCTLEIYDLSALSMNVGPTGMPSETSFAWTSDSRLLVTQIGNGLDVVDRSGRVATHFRLPSSRFGLWSHPTVATVASHAVRLIDTVTHRIYQSS